METKWCKNDCGLALDIRGWCPRHGGNIKKKPRREKIGEYSGPSKTPYGKYEDR